MKQKKEKLSTSPKCLESTEIPLEKKTTKAPSYCYRLLIVS